MEALGRCPVDVCQPQLGGLAVAKTRRHATCQAPARFTYRTSSARSSAASAAAAQPSQAATREAETAVPAAFEDDRIAQDTAAPEPRPWSNTDVGSYNDESPLAGPWSLLDEQAASLEEYEELRRRLQSRTLRFGLGVTAYIALTGTTQASLCCLGGLGAGLVYFNLLRRQVEALQPGQALPMQAAERIRLQPVKAFALGLAAYSYALRPRLAIPVAIAAGIAAWNHSGCEPQLGWGDDIALIVGFLSFKAALLLQVWDDTKPRVKTLAELRAPKRPIVEMLELDDTPFDLRKRTGR